MQGSFMSCLLGIVISYFAETLHTCASGLIAVVGPSAFVDQNGVVAPPVARLVVPSRAAAVLAAGADKCVGCLGYGDSGRAFR